MLAGPVDDHHLARRSEAGPAAVRAWIDGKHAEAEKRREEAENLRLERRWHLSGWSAHGTGPMA
jgi:hypothetical protein